MASQLARAARPRLPNRVKPQDSVGVLSSVVAEQMLLMTEQRDLLTRVEELLIELVQSRFGSSDMRAAGSTVVTFARDQEGPPPHGEA